LSSDFFDAIENLSNEEIAFEAIKQFIGDEIPAPVLKNYCRYTVL
jgi:threonine synthase